LKIEPRHPGRSHAVKSESPLVVHVDQLFP
jgi:hypothetical protein